MKKTEPPLKIFSIAPKSIYGNLEWRDEERDFSTILNEDLEQDHVEVLQIFPNEETLKNPLPSSIRVQTEKFRVRMQEIHEYFNAMTVPNSQTGFDTVHVRLKNFSFIKNQILITNQKEVYGLYELNRSNERYLFPSDYFRDLDRLRSEKVPELVNSYISISAGSPNWGHFLVDELPRICKFIASCDSSEVINIYMTDYSSNQVKLNQNKIEAIRYLHVNRSIEFHLMPENQVNQFKSASYISPITFHPFYKNKEFLNTPRLLNSFITKDLGKDSKEKIFCIRTTGARSLSKSAIAQLKSLFEPLGYFFYSPENDSVENQFRIFTGAKTIIGLMGAGMCNSMFSGPGTKLIYIAPSGWEETFFWNLANQLGHEYHVYYSEMNKDKEQPEEDTFNLDLVDFFAYFKGLAD
jgi:capsular polysaccharide biosynthesis protein